MRRDSGLLLLRGCRPCKGRRDCSVAFSPHVARGSRRCLRQLHGPPFATAGAAVRALHGRRPMPDRPRRWQRAGRAHRDAGRDRRPRARRRRRALPHLRRRLRARASRGRTCARCLPSGFPGPTEPSTPPSASSSSTSWRIRPPDCARCAACPPASGTRRVPSPRASAPPAPLAPRSSPPGRTPSARSAVDTLAIRGARSTSPHAHGPSGGRGPESLSGSRSPCRRCCIRPLPLRS